MLEKTNQTDYENALLTFNALPKVFESFSDDFKKKELDCLFESKNTVKILKSHKCKNVYQLATMSQNKIEKIKGLSKKALLEIAFFKYSAESSKTFCTEIVHKYTSEKPLFSLKTNKKEKDNDKPTLSEMEMDEIDLWEDLI